MAVASLLAVHGKTEEQKKSYIILVHKNNV